MNESGQVAIVDRENDIHTNHGKIRNAGEEDTIPDNPFAAFAMLLRKVNTALECTDTGKNGPRWQRIVRVRNYKGNRIADAVSSAVEGLLNAIGFIHRFSMEAKDLLEQADGAVALVACSREFILTVSSDKFVNSLFSVMGGELTDNPLSNAGKFLGNVLKFVDYVPTPENLDEINKGIYKLMCIKMSGDTVDIAETGKLRLLQWGLDLSERITVYKDKGSGNFSLDTKDFSKRIPSQNSSMNGYFPINPPKEIIFEINTQSPTSFSDLCQILTHLGYLTAGSPPTSMADILSNLHEFQKENSLDISGTLDIATLHRLMNLDVAKESVTKALKKKIASAT